MPELLSVTALNRYVKQILDANDILFDLAIKGEISNFIRNAKSGHCYFSLKDEKSSVKAVMFAGDARKLGFKPENGMQVVLRCRVTLYERDGAFQLYVTDIFPSGVGAAQLAFEQLKAKLEAEGLFDVSRKKNITEKPKTVGVVTSKTGAALQDILNVFSRRWPMIKVVLAPVSVQGFEAAEEIAKAIETLDKTKKIDTIIVARGGGSKEDLWVFNAEIIARAAAKCKTPLISAIGHEIDFTILDFVSDLRAPTPSAAAELAVPNIEEFRKKIYNLQENIQKNMQFKLDVCYNRTNMQVAIFEKSGVDKKFLQSVEKLDALKEKIQTAMQKEILSKTDVLRRNSQLADSLSPLKTLSRGYSMVKDENGTVRTVEELCVGQKINLLSNSAVAECLVTKMEKTK